MGRTLRKSGIDVVGDIPWGTHFCQFYQTQADLIDILVSYFRAGLEANEFCMWVTAHPLTETEAEAALRAAYPELDDCRARGQIEIVPHTAWYLKDGVFDSRRVLTGWVDKLSGALQRGFAGLRLTGNTFWLERNGWGDFLRYEDEVNTVIGNYRMVALCTYSLDRCNAREILDVVHTHQFALVKREGKWDLIESAEHRRAAQALRERTEELESLPFPIDAALHCGLIINELISNSLKYAFPAGKPGTIFLGLRRVDGDTELRYRDDGPGLPPDLDLARIKSLGLKIVYNLAVRQLRGTIDVRRDPGTEFVFRFRGFSHLETA